MRLHIAFVAVSLAALSCPPARAADERSAAPEASSALQEVTVTAKRLELTNRVSEFVNQIADGENGAEAMARWQAPPMCPLVSGLPRRDGEFILARLSETARTAGVPLSDKEGCQPNLYVLLTDQPEELLRGMEKRNREFTFGYDSSSYPPTLTKATVVDEFIQTPRAVRVWYNSAEKDIWYNPVGYCPARDLGLDPSLQFVKCSRGIAGGSHLVFNELKTFYTVFVIVDQTQLHDVKIGQLADYVAMAAFAKLKANARLGNAPTILNLFNGAPKSAPSGLTAWDQAFLKSLYGTDQRAKTQRSSIAREMVREIAP